MISDSESIVKLGDEIILFADASNTDSISLIASTIFVAVVFKFSVVPMSSCNSLTASITVGPEIFISSFAAAGVFNSIALPNELSILTIAP